MHPEPGLVAVLYPKPCRAYVHRDVDVIAVPRVHVHSMEAGTGAIDDLEPLTLLHSQVNQQRAVREICKGLRRGGDSGGMARVGGGAEGRRGSGGMSRAVGGMGAEGGP